MTVTGVTQAQDEGLKAFRDAWELGAPSQGVPLLYDDVASAPPTSGPWARVSFRNVAGRQATLSGETGRRMFQHTGVASVQIFTPTGDGRVLADQLAQIAKNSFEGTTTAPGDVRFRNARILHVGQEGSWYQTNVLADFEYEEVR